MHLFWTFSSINPLLQSSRRIVTVLECEHDLVWRHYHEMYCIRLEILSTNRYNSLDSNFIRFFHSSHCSSLCFFRCFISTFKISCTLSTRSSLLWNFSSQLLQGFSLWANLGREKPEIIFVRAGLFLICLPTSLTTHPLSVQTGK